jgi:hypothetical protein
MTDDHNGWNDAPEAEREAVDVYARQEFGRPGTARQERTMAKHYEGLPAAANMQQSIILAQLQILKDLERRKQSAAAVQLLIDSVTRLAA